LESRRSGYLRSDGRIILDHIFGKQGMKMNWIEVTEDYVQWWDLVLAALNVLSLLPECQFLPTPAIKS
jgi:hypothetical protein